MIPIQEKRSIIPTNALTGAAAVGAPLAVMLAAVAEKNISWVNEEIAAALASLLTAVIGYFFRGGRKGETA